MPNIGPMEVIVVLVLALIVLGPKKLPEMGKSLGKGMREFKDTLSGDSKDEDTVHLSAHSETPAAAPAPVAPVAAPRETTQV
jgi:sec-independent protein translocase protein TatA